MAKQFLFLLLFSLLLAPVVLQLFGTRIGKKLKGWQAPPKEVVLNSQNWLQGDWQKYQEGQAKSKFKGRPFFVRLNNQLKYSFFHQTNAKDVIEGKNGYFFEERYIHSYLGKDFDGEESIRENVSMLADISDSLHAQDIPFLMVLASGKGTFMPENFPPPYDTTRKTTNNYETYKKYFLKDSVPLLDLNQYLVDLKDTASYPLYTKGNTHWSAYALQFVVDTLLKRIELALEAALPDYTLGAITVEQQARGNDAGIYNSLNLLWSRLEEEYVYADFQVQSDSTAIQPRIWTIGDSFFGTLFDAQIPQRFFEKDSKFLYYYHQVWTHDGQRSRTKDLHDLKALLLDTDMVIIFITDANIGQCCWGMTGTFYRLFHPEE